MNKEEKISWLMNCYIGYLTSGNSERNSLALTIQRHCDSEGFSKEVLSGFLEKVLQHDIEYFRKKINELIC